MRLSRSSSSATKDSRTVAARDCTFALKNEKPIDAVAAAFLAASVDVSRLRIYAFARVDSGHLIDVESQEKADKKGKNKERGRGQQGLTKNSEK